MKVLLDTDIGSDIDDALALLLLLHLPNIQLVGVTTVYGNVEIRAKVARKILDAAGVSVPVYAGAGVPLYSPCPIWHSGTEGFGVLGEREIEQPLDACGIGRDADDFIVETISDCRGQITVIALGALTNVAQAISKQPKLCEWINGFFFMGGGVTYTDPVPDCLQAGQSYRARPSHNVRCDVKAASIVFASGLPMHIVTNDVTTQLWWDGPPVRTLITSRKPPEAAVVGTLLKIWLDYRSEIFDRQVTGTCPHDPLTAAEGAGQSFVTYSAGEMFVNTDASTVFIPSAHGRHRAGVAVEDSSFLTWFTRQVVGRK